MPSRNDLPPQDRSARSRLMKLLSSPLPIARGSLVTMARTCGNKRCKCYSGQKHVSLYLGARIGGGRKMVYIPKEMDDSVRAMVDNARKVEALLEEMSQASIDQLVQAKIRRSAARPDRR